MFYPSDAHVPEALRTDEFLLRPLRATDVTLDYDAVISSRADWPREGFTLEEMGLRFLYSLRPRQPFLDVVLAYLLEPNLNF